ncbi:MAG: 16S rRNA processing protein RimM [Tenericutes bacterium]|nr:16S rRNA processing protein RimM [Mycoplasmatota bacterium]
MDDYIYIGKIVNTHALKGEVRIISDFEFKDRVFNINNNLYIGNNKNKETIETYRRHKNYDMVKFIGIDNINDVLKYKGNTVYILSSQLILNDDELLSDDLINIDAMYENIVIGKIKEYQNNNGNKIVKINDIYIPYNKNFIEKIDIKNNKIYFKDI